MSGVLCGIGLGPGDPELLTLKAARLLGQARVVAYPAPPGRDSFAREIAAPHLAPGAEEIRLDIPMTPERAPAQAAYDAGASRIRARLAAGEEVLFLCEGDPLFYGSFMYLSARLMPEFPVRVVPGITALTACAAAARQPLAARESVLSAIPATLDSPALARAIEGAGAAAIFKLGRHLGRVRDVLRSKGLADHAVYVEHASLPRERVLPLADAPEPAPYFSMILVAKEVESWLS